MNSGSGAPAGTVAGCAPGKELRLCLWAAPHPPHQGLEIVEENTGPQAGRWGQDAQPACKRTSLEPRGKPATNCLETAAPPRGSHFGLPASEGHWSLPRAPVGLWGLLPSLFRSSSLSDCALQTTDQQKKEKTFCLTQSKLLL